VSPAIPRFISVNWVALSDEERASITYKTATHSESFPVRSAAAAMQCSAAG
jgi:hypothetical protein